MNFSYTTLGLTMHLGPVKHQVDQRRAIGLLKGSGPELDPSFGEPVIPQPTTIVGTLDYYVAPDADHVVRWVAGVVGHPLEESDQLGPSKAVVGQQQGAHGGGQIAQQPAQENSSTRLCDKSRSRQRLPSRARATSDAGNKPQLTNRCAHDPCRTSQS